MRALKPLPALLLLLALPCAAAETPAGGGILNFNEVSTGIYRGGQPDAAGWAFLKSKGVKTVVKLNYESEGSDAEAKTLGMTLIDASGPPSTVKDVWGAPKPERLKLAVMSLADKRLHPIYVHCLHGQDRTGLVVGLHRVLNEGMPKKDAWEEMKRIGFHRSLRGLRAVWKKFDGKRIPGAKP